MKNILFLILAMCCACNEEDSEEAAETQTTTITTPLIQPVADAEQACALCQMDITIAELQNLVSALFHNKSRNTEMLKAKKELDSLDKLYTQSIIAFNNDVTKIQATCATKYNTNFVTDTSKRNALFASFFAWYHNTSFPTFDTVGYIPVIKNGMYEVQDKGKTNLFTKAQHDAYLKNGLNSKAKTNKLFDNATKSLASQITGLTQDKIDRVCLYVLGFLSLSYQLHPMVTKVKETDKEFLEYIKLQTAMWE